jgi:hypothetical protein
MVSGRLDDGVQGRGGPWSPSYRTHRGETTTLANVIAHAAGPILDPAFDGQISFRTDNQGIL